MDRTVKKAVFPVAGLGTRFLPATKAIPKEMLPVVDRPLIQYAIEEAREAGIEEFLFVTGRGKSAIEDHFDRNQELENLLRERHKTEALEAITSWLPDPGQILWTRQQQPLGLGHAIWCARHFIADDEPFAVILADDMILGRPGCLHQMVKTYQQHGGNVAAVVEVPRQQTQRYGILDVATDDGQVVRAKGLVEKPDPQVAPSTLSIIGRYILQPRIFDHLNKHQRGQNGEIQLTDAIAATLPEIPFHGLRFFGKRYDCGSRLGFLEANLAFAMEQPDLREPLQQLLREMINA